MSSWPGQQVGSRWAIDAADRPPGGRERQPTTGEAAQDRQGQPKTAASKRPR